MECWKALLRLNGFLYLNFNNKTYEHGEQSEHLNSGLWNSFGLAYFGEVAQSISFTRPVKVASSSYSSTTTIANKWIKWFCRICIDTRMIKN